jgi:hypothetical protein
VQLLTSGGTLTSVAAQSGWSITGSQLINGVSFDIWHNMGAPNNASDLLIQHGINVI